MKKIFCILATVCMLGSFSMTAYAEDDLLMTTARVDEGVVAEVSVANDAIVTNEAVVDDVLSDDKMEKYGVENTAEGVVAENEVLEEAQGVYTTGAVSNDYSQALNVIKNYREQAINDNNEVVLQAVDNDLKQIINYKAETRTIIIDSIHFTISVILLIINSILTVLLLRSIKAKA